MLGMAIILQLKLFIYQRLGQLCRSVTLQIDSFIRSIFIQILKLCQKFMNHPSFLEVGRKKSTQASTPTISHYQHNQLSSHLSPPNKKPSIDLVKMGNTENNSHSSYLYEYKGLKPSVSPTSQQMLPQSVYKFEGYHRDRIGALPTQNKKTDNMKKSLMDLQNKIGYEKKMELGNSSTITQKLPRASIPNFGLEFEEEKNGYSYHENLLSPVGEKSSMHSQNKIAQKVINSQQKMFIRKSSIDIKNNDSLLHEKQRTKLTLNSFQKVKSLGSGKYGQVFLVREKVTDMLFALKIIEKKILQEEQITEQFIRELKIQLFLNHPNIIKMYGFFDDSYNIYIILETALGGQLFNYMKKSKTISQIKTAHLMRQICQAVSQLHSNQIIHRDIKPQNIVIHENVVKLCDFGWSVHQEEKFRSTFCGTPLYICPEILKGNLYDERIDIWSLGVLMYEMLIGENPFNIVQEEDLIKIVKEKVVIPSYTSISPQAQNFLLCCLQKNPEERKNIRQLLNHDFFKKYPDKSNGKIKV